MSYTITQFNKQYPNDDVCLDEIFQNRWGSLKACPDCGVVGAKFYRIRNRKCYSCMWCGYQLNPLADTIFHKSDTPLTKWFFAIYLIGNSKNSVSAKELQPHLGVTYKTAWRMAKQIRLLMKQNQDKLSGIVEADETYVGGKRKITEGRGNKTPVIGAVERQGAAKSAVTHTASRKVAERFIEANVDVTAEIHTNTSPIYHHVSRRQVHEAINHAKGEYGRGNVTTNSIEDFWSQMKRSLDGTHHCVSPEYLQSYVNYFVHAYSHRAVPIFPLLVAEAAKPVQ